MSVLVGSAVRVNIWGSLVVFDVHSGSQGSHARDQGPGVIMEIGGSMALQ